MSRPRFLADHDLNEHIVNGAHRREPTLEIVRARDVGMHACPDAEVLEYASINTRHCERSMRTCYDPCDRSVRNKNLTEQYLHSLSSPVLYYAVKRHGGRTVHTVQPRC